MRSMSAESAPAAALALVSSSARLKTSTPNALRAGLEMTEAEARRSVARSAVRPG